MKITIIYATAGIGHKKASIAVKKALDEIAPKDAQITIIDALDYTNAFFKWSYLQAYLTMVNKLPSFWGMSYYLTDNPFLNIFISKIRRMSNWINSKKLAELLISSKPDVIISTHFFASEVVGDLKRCGRLKSRLITIITDYRLHSWWIADNTDMYIAASEDAKTDLLKWKVDPSKIKVLGIPAEPVFSKPLNKDEILNKVGFKKGVFTVLIIGGGFGVGPIEGIVKVLKDMPVQAIVVCGHNEKLVKKIEDLKPGAKADIRAMGFVDNVYEYMDIADILISKSGGITVTEAMAKELPMLVISPILGQETRNSDFVIKHGVGIKIGKLEDLENIFRDMLDHPEKIAGMKEAVKLVKKPLACYDVARLAMEMAKEGK